MFVTTFFNMRAVSVCGVVVPVAAVAPVSLAGAYFHHRGITAMSYVLVFFFVCCFQVRGTIVSRTKYCHHKLFNIYLVVFLMYTTGPSNYAPP